MRTCFRIACLVLLAWPSLHAQCDKPDPRWEKPSQEVKTRIRNISFGGATQLPWDVQEQFAAEIRERQFSGSKWKDELGERVRDGWMQQGYFKAFVQVEVEVHWNDGREQEVSVVAHIEEGEQYRLGGLYWKNAEPFRAQDLEKLIPLKRGEIFNVEKVKDGLEALREFYASKGYINFTSVPGTEVDDKEQEINLTLDLDPGAVFRLRKFRILGVDDALRSQLLADWKMQQGDPFDARYLDNFLEQHRSLLPAEFCPAEDVCRMLYEKAHAVDLTLSFNGSNCQHPDPSSPDEAGARNAGASRSPLNPGPQRNLPFY